MALFWQLTLLSFPVDFQYPALVALLVLNPLGYFLSRGPKKYHSGSLLGRKDFSTRQTTAGSCVMRAVVPWLYSGNVAET